MAEDKGWDDRLGDKIDGVIRCCFKCGATYGGEAPYDDFSSQAIWRKNLRSHDIFMARAMMCTIYLSGLFALPGFVVEYISGDLMHNGELGVLQNMFGACMWEWFEALEGKQNHAAPTMSVMLAMIRTVFKRLGQTWLPFNTLTLQMIRAKTANSSPTLKANTSEASRLLACLIYVFENIFPPKHGHAVNRLLMLKGMSAMYQALHD